MNSCLLYLVVLIIGAAFVTTLIALAVPVWQASSTTIQSATVDIKVHSYTGLWSACTRTEVIDRDTLTCDTYLEAFVEYPDSVKGVQAMMIIGGVLTAAAFVLIIVKWCCLKDNDILAKLVFVACIAGAVFLIIGVVVWSTEVKKDQDFKPSDLNAGFALTVIAAAMLVAGGVLVCFLGQAT